jgi:hypothetical protein
MVEYIDRYHIINYSNNIDNITIEYFNDLKKKPFRLRVKKLILIYYPVFEKEEEEKNVRFDNLNQAKDEILKKLKEKIFLPRITQCIISKEKNETRGLQIYLEFNTQVDLGPQDEYYLDLKFDGKICRGVYKTVRLNEDILNYIVKCTDFIAEPPLMCLDGVYFFKLKDYLTALYNKEGLRGVKNYLAGSVEAMLNGGASVLTQLERLHKKKTKIMIEQKPKQKKIKIIPEEDYDLPKGVKEWYINSFIYNNTLHFDQLLIFIGRSGIETTEFIESFLKKRDIPFLLIKNGYNLKEYDYKKHNAILFDDIYFEKMLISGQLIDVVDHSDINISILLDLIRMITKTYKAFTTNNVVTNYISCTIEKRVLVSKKLEKINVDMDIRSTNTDNLIARNRKILALCRQDVLREKK